MAHTKTLIAAAVLLAGAGFVAVSMATTAPADLDYSLSHLSDSGTYQVSLTPDLDPVPVGQMHAWTASVSTPDGDSLQDVEISFDGGMPQHGHGLPTQPQVTGRTRDGAFVIEGVKFNMPGWWEIKLHVEGPDGSDTATFNLAL